jgi:hypothetical protein
VQLERQSQGPLLSSDNTTLIVEGIEFVRLAGGPKLDFSFIFHVTAGTLHVANCRFVREAGDKGACVKCTDVTRAEFRNTEFIRLGHEGGAGIGYHCPAAGSLLVDNCVDAGFFDFLLMHSDVSKIRQVSIRLRNNTLAAEVGIFVMLASLPQAPPQPVAAPAPSLTVESVRNVFHMRKYSFLFHARSQTAATPSHQELAELCRRYCAWREDGSLFPREMSLAVSWGDRDRDKATVANGLAEWNRHWGTASTGSLNGTPKFRGEDVYATARTGDQRLKAEDFRLHPDSPGYRAGPAGKDLGADVDLVGPGAAYERWKKTPEYQQWLKDTGQFKK